jgi:hypothetical protein
MSGMLSYPLSVAPGTTRMRAALLMSLSILPLALGACGSRGGVQVPPEALTVASVRHTAGPQPAPLWLSRAELPADAHFSDGARALLLEATLRDARVEALEGAPLELANLIVRIDARARRETVIAIENDSDATLALDLFVSPDGERFRAIPTCPVAPGGDAFERWPERAAWIALANVRVAEAGACR